MKTPALAGGGERTPFEEYVPKVALLERTVATCVPSDPRISFPETDFNLNFNFNLKLKLTANFNNNKSIYGDILVVW